MGAKATALAIVIIGFRFRPAACLFAFNHLNTGFRTDLGAKAAANTGVQVGFRLERAPGARLINAAAPGFDRQIYSFFIFHKLW